jgi:hypothetical protein
VRSFPATCWPASRDTTTSRVPSLEQRLLHEADCDELRSQYDDAASNLREQHRWQNARRAKTYSRS